MKNCDCPPACTISGDGFSIHWQRGPAKEPEIRTTQDIVIHTAMDILEFLEDPETSCRNKALADIKCLQQKIGEMSTKLKEVRDG